MLWFKPCHVDNGEMVNGEQIANFFLFWPNKYTVLDYTLSARRSNRQSRGIILKVDATDYIEDDVGLYLNLG